MGIMLMIGAQVARGESTPGINKYVKEIKRIRDSTLSAHVSRCSELRKSAAKHQTKSQTPSYTLLPIEEKSLSATQIDVNEVDERETSSSSGPASPNAFSYTLGGSKVKLTC